MCNCALCQTLTNDSTKKFISQIEKPFSELPHLPDSWVEFLVKIIPWGVGLSAVFSFFGALSNLRLALGRGVVNRMLQLYGGVSPAYFAMMAVFQALVFILAVKAFTPLRERQLKGWILLFWSNALALLESLVVFFFLNGSATSMVIGTLLGYYLLFEVKKAYEPEKVAKKTSKTKKSI